MTREEIKKQWELEFGVKYEDYQRANVYTATDILDFAESVVNKLLISGVSQQRELLLQAYKDGFQAATDSIIGANEMVKNKNLQ